MQYSLLRIAIRTVRTVFKVTYTPSLWQKANEMCKSSGQCHVVVVAISARDAGVHISAGCCAWGQVWWLCVRCAKRGGKCGIQQILAAAVVRVNSKLFKLRNGLAS